MTSSEARPSAEAEGREQQATAPRGHGWVGPYQILGGKCAPELSDTLALFPSYELDLGRGCHVCGHQDGGADQAGTFEHFGLIFESYLISYVENMCRADAVDGGGSQQWRLCGRACIDATAALGDKGRLAGPGTARGVSN